MTDTSKDAVNQEIRLLREGYGRNELIADLLEAMLDELEGYRRRAKCNDTWEDRMGGQFTQEELSRPGWL